jgi:hypothetical protein
MRLLRMSRWLPRRLAGLRPNNAVMKKDGRS